MQEPPNVILSEIPLSAFSVAMLTFTIVMYFTYNRRVQQWYYNRSLQAHGAVGKSYTVTWRIIDSFAIAFVCLCILGVSYVVGGMASDGGMLYSVSKNTFRYYILLPVILFWLFAGFSLCVVLFVRHILSYDGNDKVAEKLQEFAGSLQEISQITDTAFSSGQKCNSAGRYKIIERNTKTQKGEIQLRAGETFPHIGKNVVQYVKLD